MIFKPIRTSSRKNVAYVIGDEESGEMAVVDIGHGPDRVIARVDELGGNLKYMLATHSHGDHLGKPEAIAEVREATGALLAAYKTVKELQPGDVPLEDGDVLELGGIRIKVIHTPGHTGDSLCYLVDNRKLFTGDTLFVSRASKGRSKRVYYNTLHEIVMKLPDHIEVWPGHDVGPSPSSTIGNERRTNYVLHMSYENFRDRWWDEERERWVV